MNNDTTIANISSFISSNVFVEEGLVASHSLSSVCKLHAGQVKHSIPFDVIAGGEQCELHMHSIRRALFQIQDTQQFHKLRKPSIFPKQLSFFRSE
jgi:hypothetical protein